MGFLYLLIVTVCLIIVVVYLFVYLKGVNMTYLVIFIFVAALLFVYRFVYFKRVSFLVINAGQASIQSARPSFGWFRSGAFGCRSSFVKLGDGYTIMYPSSTSKDDQVSYILIKDILFNNPVYVFRIRFGRLRSVDFDSRFIQNFLNSINK